ncbi:glycosyltransferase [Phycicoccus sp. HDW14]|uniref:glycosyltransferase family protein n=1 Tax=Phycicoccus sp. HDW14 TaxID=2714941 RepID=UPI00140986E1|nr:glycosyltransferase [Phycicoccus sp. HDW14]QIM21333.1 glycosyltransferase [Phycicoccus sp. HDW14]
MTARTRTLLLTEHPLGAWRARFERGEVPSALPYGVDVLASRGHELAGPPPPVTGPAAKVRDVVEHRSGIPVERTVRSLGAVHRADLVLALLEREGMLAGIGRGLRVPPFRSTPLVVWSCWLADDVRTADRATRARLGRRMRSADLVTHLSRHETGTLVDLGIPEERLFPVTYGVSHRFYTPGDGERDIELLAVGQDRGRDYATLVEAVRGTDLTLDVVCKPENLDGLDLPPNVRVHGTVPLPTYREMLRRAQVVAVPTRDLAYPTGSSVALEAASSGCAVAVTGTRAMRDYFTDDETAVLVREGDVDGWRASLTALRDDPQRRARLGAAARRSVEERFNADHMWTELDDVVRERGILPARD